ncbi:MAG: ABC transporter permease [Pandoraea sp.]|nr:ABC transporter permease [Pandoraea sp.]MDR3400100.1 ABC transporter permease [Pandoraea sp.]
MSANPQQSVGLLPGIPKALAEASPPPRTGNQDRERRQAIEDAVRRSRRTRHWSALGRQWLLGGIGCVIFLVIWEIVPRLIPGINLNMFPPPSRVAGVFAELTWGSAEIWPHVAASLQRALWGFLLGASLGVIAGVLTGYYPTLRHLSDPVLHGLRAIPSIAIVPLAIVWFGLGDLSKVMLIAWGAFFPVWINTFFGVRDISPAYLRSAASLGARPTAIALQVALPAALPFVFAGLRQATSVSFVVLVAAELVGSEKGLGFLISFAHLVFRVDIMFVGLIYLGALGFVADQLFAWVLHRLFPWYGAEARR